MVLFYHNLHFFIIFIRYSKNKIKQQYTTKHKKTSTDSSLGYSEALALSLVSHAKKDKEFAHYLKSAVSRNLRSSSPVQRIRIQRNIAALALPDSDAATRRANWLIGQVKERATPGAFEAEKILAAFAQGAPEEYPKQVPLTVGMLRIIIPGITMGRFKKKETMTIIIERNIARKNKKTMGLPQMVSRASLGVMRQALNHASRDTGNIEPEIADWFYGERKLMLYKTSEEELLKIKKELNELGVIYSLVKREGNPAVLAVSPAVDSAWQSKCWNIKPL